MPPVKSVTGTPAPGAVIRLKTTNTVLRMRLLAPPLVVSILLRAALLIARAILLWGLGVPTRPCKKQVLCWSSRIQMVLEKLRLSYGLRDMSSLNVDGIFEWED